MGYDGSVFPIKALQLKRPKRFDQKNLYKRPQVPNAWEFGTFGDDGEEHWQVAETSGGFRVGRAEKWYCWSSILIYENKWSWWFSSKLSIYHKDIYRYILCHGLCIYFSYFSVICHDMSLFVPRMCLNRFGVYNFQPTKWASELIFIQRGAGSL